VGAILWPTRARARRRGEALREKLSLPDSHALGDRRFVELWERSDEKLDEWIKNTKGDRVLFDFVGDPKTINLEGLKEDGIYRMYDTSNRVFVLRGIGYNMENLAKAIEEIGRRTEMLQTQIMDKAKAAQEGGRAEEPANNDDSVAYDLGTSGTATSAPSASATPVQPDAAPVKQPEDTAKTAKPSKPAKAPKPKKADAAKKDAATPKVDTKDAPKKKAAAPKKTPAKKAAAKPKAKAATKKEA
jgi:hypothetical protein